MQVHGRWAKHHAKGTQANISINAHLHPSMHARLQDKRAQHGFQVSESSSVGSSNKTKDAHTRARACLCITHRLTHRHKHTNIHLWKHACMAYTHASRHAYRHTHTHARRPRHKPFKPKSTGKGIWTGCLDFSLAVKLAPRPIHPPTHTHTHTLCYHQKCERETLTPEHMLYSTGDVGSSWQYTTRTG